MGIVKVNINQQTKGESMTKQEANKYLCAILTTLAEVPFAPESSIYLAMGMDLGKWQTIRAILLQAGLATSEGYAMTITAKGRELAAKINQMVAA